MECSAQQVVCFFDNIAQSAKGRLVMGASLSPQQPSAEPPFLLNLLFSKVILFVCLFLAVIGLYYRTGFSPVAVSRGSSLLWCSGFPS